MKLFALLSFLALTNCGYSWGHRDRSLPGNHKTVFVSIFENQSPFVGAEADFTKALVYQLERSGFAVVESKNSAELILEGSILQARTSGSASISKFPTINNASGTAKTFDASLFTDFVLNVSANISAKRTRDKKTVWQTHLNSQKPFRGPRLKKDGLRSSNALYNHSAKKIAMRDLANEMMAEAFDRLTENF